MKIFLICLILIAVILVAVLFLVKLRLFVYLSLKEKRVYLKVGFVKIPLYPKGKKQEKPAREPSGERTSMGIRSFLGFWKENSSHIKKSLLRIKRRVRIEKFNFYYKCGFDDASLTAMLYGGVNGVFYNIYAFLDRNFKVKEMRGDIFADFNGNKKQISLDCVLYLTVSDIIYAVWALLPVIKNIKKYL